MKDNDTRALHTYLGAVAGGSQVPVFDAFHVVRQEHGTHPTGWHRVFRDLLNDELSPPDADRFKDTQRCLEDIPDAEYEPGPASHDDHPFQKRAGLSSRRGAQVNGPVPSEPKKP